ncbi:sulfoxide reductase heme-binding subunit YedZ [Duganella sp. BJB488]|uniref:sulfite oxidase heme-binding subunit YedZ n=1 Tax=unclassified Duganella TaxID=2636909 RepID=UPI000E350B3D|nr:MULTISPECIES: protein-methionine-sulfoxide reductase heme-binding subunit MsrQ [unclassified Duganella]NVD71972.1 sulfoxide reductase heme-binding subunit YedZ [Duganella sp. BJB1802]RFP14098.1 sulfoxide reductase heme-binding subunit YedZ [Duganella sp. BJB489]RFP17320.1 sulfoxide reductase heme-binding subunit YedZ [Duganella sp. BJB488]RFP31892.1 sulfoxide reductase heme-binding subunit YedZ [Duganella sp. BJB480]
MAFNPTARQTGLIKAALFVLALVPLARMVYLTLTGQLVEPLEFITRGTGDWTLYFLCFTLAVTPLRKLSKWNWLIKLRRMMGLYMFFYGVLHFMTFLWFDHFFDVQEMWKDVLKRPFITVGFIAFVLLIPLAATSTNGMIKRLGGKRWQWLHRLIYVIAPLAILHFWWMKAGKHNFTQPIIFGLILGALLLMRVYWARGKALSAAAAR